MLVSYLCMLRQGEFLEAQRLGDTLKCRLRSPDKTVKGNQKMNYFSKTLLAASALVTASMANAEGLYFGLGYQIGTYDETGVPEADLSAIKLEAGSSFSENIAVEAHVNLGMDSDTVAVPVSSATSVDVDVDLESSVSLFFKGDLPLSPDFNLYGLVGFSQVKVEASAEGFSESSSDTGFSYGAGAELALGNQVYVSAEYVSYISEDEYDYTGINLGVHKAF